MPLDPLVSLRCALIGYQLLDVSGGLVTNSYNSIKCKSTLRSSTAKVVDNV